MEETIPHLQTSVEPKGLNKILNIIAHIHAIGLESIQDTARRFLEIPIKKVSR